MIKQFIFVSHQDLTINHGVLALHCKKCANQVFSECYIIDREYTGTKYAKGKQVAHCGNAVPSPFAEALARANLPEMCVGQVRAA